MEIRSIELSSQQEAVRKILMSYIEAIEQAIAIDIDATDGENIAYCINQRQTLLSTTPKMMEIATAILNWSMGEVAREILADERMQGAKERVIKAYMSGRIGKWEALYKRAERCNAALVHSLDSLRSLLSRDKELVKMNGYR